ncbi:MAG: hypothetical protein WBJ33_10180 [Candidatus Nanopelagicales bacterium]|jgi:hypothetical protein
MGEEVRVHRRGFLAAMGLTAGAALVLRSAVSAQASTVKAPVRGKNDSRFRRGRFRRGQVWTIPGGSLLVKRRRAIRSVDGGTRFDRNSFDVLFTKRSGRHPGHGTVTMTGPDGISMPMHLVQLGPNLYSATVNREQISGVDA